MSCEVQSNTDDCDDDDDDNAEGEDHLEESSPSMHYNYLFLVFDSGGSFFAFCDEVDGWVLLFLGVES